MTDRYNYLIVGLEKDVRQDDAQDIIAAIKQLRGVLNVKPNVSNSDAWIAAERARIELGDKLLKVLNEAKLS